MKNQFSLLLLTFLFLGCSTSNKITRTKNTISTKFHPTNIKIYSQPSKQTLGPCEPSVCINPTNTNNIVVGSVLNYVHTSQDGGKTWKTSTLKSNLGVWGDPVITADSKGNFYYFHLSDPDGTNWASNRILDRIVVQKSIDKGKTWSTGVGIGKNTPKQQDKQWATVNPKTDELYVTWTEFDKYKGTSAKDKSRILFSKSNDGGNTWITPKQISINEGNCSDDDLTTEGAVPISDGKNIYVAWAYNNKIWLNKSNDNGATWLSSEKEIATQNSGWKFSIGDLKRANGFPVTGIDLSNSKHKGTIYINYSNQIDSNTTEVLICKSTNNGNTWSTPKQVHLNSKNIHRFFNWMSIDPNTGYIYIVYYEKSSIESPLIEVKLAVSKNAAKSFKNYTISKTPFNPNGSNFFGDYNTINVNNGIIVPVWTQVENGLVSIWTALINEHNLK